MLPADVLGATSPGVRNTDSLCPLQKPTHGDGSIAASSLSVASDLNCYIQPIDGPYWEYSNSRLKSH